MRNKIKFKRTPISNTSRNSIAQNGRLKSRVARRNRTPIFSLIGASLRASLSTEVVGDSLFQICTLLVQ